MKVKSLKTGASLQPQPGDSDYDDDKNTGVIL